MSIQQCVYGRRASNSIHALNLCFKSNSQGPSAPSRDVRFLIVFEFLLKLKAKLCAYSVRHPGDLKFNFSPSPE